MDESWSEVDLSNQIDNSWNKDSALAIKNNNKGFSLKIRTEDKKELKRKFIWESGTEQSKKHNRRVVVIIYCFMLYKLLKNCGDIGKLIKICNDAGPRWAVNKYLNAILKYYNEKPIGEFFRLKFKSDSDPESCAHNLARKVMRGRTKEDLLITKKDVEELEEVIRKIL